MSVNRINSLDKIHYNHEEKTQALKDNTSDVSVFEADLTREGITENDDLEDKDVSSNDDIDALMDELDSIKNEQGLIGKVWDGIKNLFGMKNGSDRVEETIEKAESGEISLDEAKEHLEDYKKGQEQSTDIVADIVSGISSFAAFSLATGAGVAAAPLTGGASLGLVAAGVGAAGASGAAAKVAVKSIDAAVGGKEYDTLGYDLATGSINGIFTPITAGIGGAAGKSVAGCLGVSAIKEGSEVVLKEGLKQTAKGAIVKTLLTTNISYTGGSLLARGASFGVDVAVNGAISGGVDSAVRYAARDEEEKTIEGFLKETAFGTLGGAIASPVIGGGMRFAGNAAGKFTGKIKDSIQESLTTAQKNLLNVPKVENPDGEFLKNITAAMKGAEAMADGADGIRQIQDLASGFTNTQAYKQLGNMPDRLKTAVNNLTSDSEQTRKLALEFIEEAYGGNTVKAQELYTSYKQAYIRYCQNTFDTIQNADKTFINSGLNDTVDTLIERATKRTSSKEFSSLSRDAQDQAIIEDSNIALPKFIQTLSSDETIPDDMRVFFKQFTSNCTVSRNLDEAQKLADELYGSNKYTLKKSFGAGTIGETYLAQTEDGNEYVIKMLKEGVNLEKFETDRNMFVKYIEEFVSDGSEKEYKLKLINGLFDSWEKELDFSLEAKGAADMAKNATRFNVAQTVEVGNKNGQNISLVMQKADGVRLDSLLDMISYAKKHPKNYLKKSVLDADGNELNPWIKNASLVEENPWLKDYKDWEKTLGLEFQKAQNEQVMFVPKNGDRTIHGDPHTGNIFIGYDTANKKPIINYIDTGNTIERTPDKMLEDMSLSLNMMIGNSKGIAEYLLNGAIIPDGASKKELADKMASMLDKRLYKANVNLKSTSYTQSVFDSVMKELNIIPNADDSNLMKATLQRIKTSREICDITETTSSKTTDIKDLAAGLTSSFKAHPVETAKAIAPVAAWAGNNKEQAMNTLFQMISKTPSATANKKTKTA